MKKMKFIYIAILTLAFAACSKDALDVENPNALPEEDFWVTANDAQMGVNAIYAMNYKTGLWARWIYFRYDLTSDIGWSNSPWVELADWTRFQYINYNFWEGSVNTWRDHYKAIFRCNQVIYNVPFINMDETERDQIVAQAKFWRGFYYYNLAVLYEDVPLVLEPSEPDDLPAKRTVEEVFAQAEMDLMDAVADLPVQWEGIDLGRPTKGSANAYLARTYAQQHKWSEAKTALDYFFTGEGMGRYDLVANYYDNFTHYNENNSESVFEIQFSDANIGAGDGEVPNSNMGTHRAQFFAPGGIGWGDGQVRPWVVEAFKNEPNADGGLDERLRYTAFYSDLQEDFGDLVYGREWQWPEDFCYFRKYHRDYYRTGEDYYNQVNLRLVRYADVLLLYAEVLNELGMTGDAYQYVDRVRARANMVPLATAYPEIGTNPDAFLERLKTERVLELAGESTRWMDLKRWGDLDTQTSVDAIAERDPDFNNFVIGKHHRLPIPQIEVQNNPNLPQHNEY